MTAQRYSAMLARLRAHPRLCRGIQLAAQASVALVYLLYAGLLAWLAWQGDTRLLRAVLVPAAVFLLGTALRAAIDRPAPTRRSASRRCSPRIPGAKACPAGTRSRQRASR